VHAAFAGARLMTSELRTVGRHTLIYGAGIVASKLVSFVMLPVYTRYLTTADYGVLELLSTTIDVIGMIGSIGLAAGVFKHYAELDREEDQRELMSTVAIGTTGLALLVMVIGLLASPLLTRLLFGGRETPLYFRLFFVIYFLQSIGNLTLLMIQAEQRSQLFVGLNVVKLVVTLGFTILFVVHLGLGVRGVLLGSVIGSGLLAVGLAAYTFRRVGLHFSYERFRGLSRFGAPMVVWTVGSFILTFSDRYFLNYYTGAAAVGVYSLAYKFSFLLSAFAVAPFSQIWEPRRFAIARQPDAGEIYRRMFLYLNIALFVGSACIILFIKDALTIMVGADFVVAYQVVPLLLATTIIQQWTGYCNIGLYLEDAMSLYAWSAVVGVACAMAFNALLIPRFGMFGAAWATVAAYALRFVPVYLFSQAKYHVSYGWGKVVLLSLLLVGVWAVRRAADGLPLPSSIAVSVALLPVVAAVLYRGLLGVDERLFVRAILRRPLSALITRGVS
jgi:O-antigen/teichoic acid export membrane protein